MNFELETLQRQLTHFFWFSFSTHVGKEGVDQGAIQGKTLQCRFNIACIWCV